MVQNSIPEESIRFVKKYLKQKNNLSVVDLGCGEGYFLFGLKDDPDLTFQIMQGVDLWKDENHLPFASDLNISYNACIQVQKKNPYIESVQKDIVDFLKCTTNTYDLIIASNILHFYKKKQIEKLITRCFELLNQGGVLYIKMVNSKHPHSKDYKTIYSDDLLLAINKICAIEKVCPLEIHAVLIIVK